MDRYIKKLMYMLSRNYKVTVTTVMYYSDESKTVGNAINLRICEKGSKTAIHEFTTHSKRSLVLEMMEWADRLSP